MTAPNWTPEREISPAGAAALIRDQFPALSGAEVTPFAQGWDNTAFVVRAGNGSEYVFRFPRRAIALEGVHREARWLPQLAPLLPLPIPVPQFQGVWSEEPESEPPARWWPFWGAALVPGGELALAGIPAAGRGAPAGSLGAFLRSLHGLDPDAFDAASEAPLARDPMGRGDPARRVAMTVACLDRLREGGLDVPVAAATALVERAAELPPPPAPGVICHGDLHIRHVLVDPAKPGSAAPARVTGVIDWGDLCLADPSVDLSIGYAAFDGDSRREFLAAYGTIGPDRELRARALAVSLSALLAEYALAHREQPGGLSALLPEACAGLSRALTD